MTSRFEAAQILARRKIGETPVSRLPINPLELDPNLLTLLGSYQAVSLVVGAIARDEFDLVIDKDGYIDLPKQAPREPESRLQVRYKDPTQYVVSSSEMPSIRKKSTKRNADNQHIDTED